MFTTSAEGRNCFRSSDFNKATRYKAKAKAKDKALGGKAKAAGGKAKDLGFKSRPRPEPNITD